MQDATYTFEWRDEDNASADHVGVREQPVRDSDDLEFANIKVWVISWIVVRQICVCHGYSR